MTYNGLRFPRSRGYKDAGRLFHLSHTTSSCPSYPLAELRVKLQGPYIAMSADSVPPSPQMYDFEKEDLIDIFFDKPKGGHGHGGRKGDGTFYDHVVEKCQLPPWNR